MYISSFPEEYLRKNKNLLTKHKKYGIIIIIMKKEVAGMKKGKPMVAIVKGGEEKLVSKEELKKYALIGEIPQELVLMLEYILTCLESSVKN